MVVLMMDPSAVLIERTDSDLSAGEFSSAQLKGTKCLYSKIVLFLFLFLIETRGVCLTSSVSWVWEEVQVVTVEVKLPRGTVCKQHALVQELEQPTWSLGDCYTRYAATRLHWLLTPWFWHLVCWLWDYDTIPSLPVSCWHIRQNCQNTFEVVQMIYMSWGWYWRNIFELAVLKNLKWKIWIQQLGLLQLVHAWPQDNF